LILAGCLLGLLFYPEDEGNMILRNIDKAKQKKKAEEITMLAWLIP
jgi:hypothetical protein